jgi:hypothetical protein
MCNRRNFGRGRLISIIILLGRKHIFREELLIVKATCYMVETILSL